MIEKYFYRGYFLEQAFSEFLEQHAFFSPPLEQHAFFSPSLEHAFCSVVLQQDLDLLQPAPVFAHDITVKDKSA